MNVMQLIKQLSLCGRLPTPADSVTLPAFAAARRSVAWLLLIAGHAAVDRYLLLAGPTAANSPQIINERMDVHPTVA